MTKKLLVADDSLTIQKVIRLALSSEGYEIQAVSDGHDALEQIALFRPDVVLIDVALPMKSAFDVKQELNMTGDAPNTKIILMSSAFERLDEQMLQSAGFDGRITKPFDPAQLRSVLQQALGKPKKQEAEDFSQWQMTPPPKTEKNDIEQLTEATFQKSPETFTWAEEPSIAIPTINTLQQPVQNFTLKPDTTNVHVFPKTSEVIQKTLDTEVRQEIQKILPDLAEKLLREEIKKLLGPDGSPETLNAS